MSHQYLQARLTRTRRNQTRFVARSDRLLRPLSSHKPTRLRCVHGNRLLLRLRCSAQPRRSVCCGCEDRDSNPAALGSVPSFRSRLSCDRFQPPNVRESGYVFETGGISAFREWRLPGCVSNSTRCAAARPLRAQSRRAFDASLCRFNQR